MLKTGLGYIHVKYNYQQVPYLIGEKCLSKKCRPDQTAP